MRHRVVIIGAGFAGLSAATQIPEEHEVTVLSRHPWCEFLPNIHELVSGQKQTQDLRLDAKGRIESLGHRFVLDEVVEIDVHGRAVRARSTGTHPFDVLIVAGGGVNATAGVAGAERAMPFKSVEDCARIHDRLRDVAMDASQGRVVVVGGGLEGVEALGEVLRAFPRLRIDVIDGAPRLMSNEPASLDQTIRRECEPFDVTLSVGTTVAEVRADGVVTGDDRLVPSDVTIWTGGPAGAPLLFDSGLATRLGGWAPVTPTLESMRAAGVFVVGDAAQLDDPVTKQAYHAIDMGLCAGTNAGRFLAGESCEPFSPAEKPTLVSFGHLGCFLVVGEWAVFGRAVSIAKEAVFQLVSAQLVPPVDVSTTMKSFRRLTGSLPELSWPSLWVVWQGLLGAMDVRVLPPTSRGSKDDRGGNGGLWSWPSV